MSVAFRRESDEEHLEPKFELPIPPGPNVVTPAGLAQIEAKVAELEAAAHATSDEEAQKRLQRELRYWRQRESSAQVAPTPTDGKVGIGSHVRFRLRDAEQIIHITGHDEADPAQGRIASSAPLARVMMGAEVGDWLDFAETPEAIEILEVRAG